MDTVSEMGDSLNDSPAGLDRVQRWMQAVITHPDGVLTGADEKAARELIDAGQGNLESVVTRSRSLSAADRLAIYANAYYARLLECMANIFPVLRRTLGEDIFNGFAFEYLQSFPSRSYTLNHLGQHFVQYLRETRPGSEKEDDAGWVDFLISLSTLEWTIYGVFDGPGTETESMLEASDVESIDPDAWLDIRLETPPCLALLALDYPVNEFYTAVRASEEELELPFVEPAVSYVAISRRDYIVRRYELSHPQYRLLKSLHEGETVGKALEACAGVVPDDELDQLIIDVKLWFRNWTMERCFFRKILV